MKKPPLANAELAVMKLLWKNSPMTAREIRERLYPDEEKAQHGTVQRLLQRLEDKGYVIRGRSISVHFFSPKIDRRTYAGNQLESLTSKITGGSLAPLVTHLMEKNRLSRDDIVELREILDNTLEKQT